MLRMNGWIVLALSLLGGFATARAQDDAPPVLNPPSGTPASDDRSELLDAGETLALPLADGPAHEAFRAPRRPPEPIVERPSAARTDARTVWIKGYWEWDEARKDFAWAVGGWRVPPPGKAWADGSWKEDARGWYRVPGTWVDSPEIQADWRRHGPPATHPEEAVGPAPAPAMFFIAGIYEPVGDQLVWKPGSWSESRPGWEWIPARWVRQTEGWAFRPGSWRREGSAASTASSETPPDAPTAAPRPKEPVTLIRRESARPAFDRPIPTPPTPGGTSALGPLTNGPSPVVGASGNDGSPAGTSGSVASGNESPPPQAPGPSYVVTLPDGRRVLLNAPAQDGTMLGPGVSPYPPAAPATAPGGPPPRARRGLPLLRLRRGR